MLTAGAMRRALALLSAIAFLVLAGPPYATADADVNAADERAGSCAGFEGVAFVFCVALCEARACDLRDPDDARCAVLRRGFSRTAGGLAPPCEGGVLASAAPARDPH